MRGCTVVVLAEVNPIGDVKVQEIRRIQHGVARYGFAARERQRSLKRMNDYVTRKKPELIARLEEYLAGTITHEQIKELAWDIIEKSPQPSPPDEETFWSTAFAIVHVADAGHWNAGVTQPDLGAMLDLLKTGRLIPPEWKTK